MSYISIQNINNIKLAGIKLEILQLNLVNLMKKQSQSLLENRVPHENNNTIILILISAIIFITVIAIYDVIKNILTIYYAKRASNKSKQ